MSRMNGPSRVAIVILALAGAVYAQQLPVIWVNNNEGNTLYSYTLTLPSTWTPSAPPGCTFHAPYWSGSPTFAGLQSAVNDIEACRTATAVGILLLFPPSLYTTSNALGLVIPQSNTIQSTNFLILASTQDAMLPNGTTVCSHGIQDNLSTSTDIGLDNPDCAGDAMYYQLGTIQTIAGTVHANDGLDDLPPYTVPGSNWNVCILPSCNPGGVGNPTATQTINNASPSLDGASMKMVCASASASDCLFYYNASAEDSDTSLSADFWMYLDANGGTANAFEFVMFQYIAGSVNTELHYSYQCDNNSGFWRVGNLTPSFSWVLTTIPCSLSDLTWHHIILRAHRIAGDTSCSGHPAEYYDSIAIDGTVYSSLPTECSIVLPAGWSEATGLNFQQDMGSSATTLTEYVDEVNFTSIGPAGTFTLANGITTNTANYNDAQYMWTLESSGSNPSAMTFCSPVGASSSSAPPKCAATAIGPDHWLIMDGEARMSTGNTGNNNIVSQSSTGTETTIMQYPAHIHFRKMWVHGDWTSLIAGANSVSSGININCTYCSIVDSQVSQALRPGSEGHAITAQGQGPYKIDHNWVEGDSIGLFTGGAESGSPYSIFGFVSFQNVEVRRNRFTFPYAWLGQMTIPGGNAHWAGASIERKNIAELKNGERVLYSGNIFENSDNSGGQGGVIGDWNVQNFLLNYQLAMTDVTFVNNIMRNTCEGFEIDASTPNQSEGGGVSFPFMRGIWFYNLLYNITATNPGCSGVNATNIEASAALFQWQGTVTQIDSTHAQFVGNCSVNGGSTGSTGGTCPGQLSGFTVVSGGTGCVAGSLAIGAPNIVGGIQAKGTYTCSGGALAGATLTNQGSGYTAAPTVTIATGTGTLSATVISLANPPALGSQVMDVSAGDHIQITNCQSVSAFNVATTTHSWGTAPNGIGPAVTSGSAIWTGTYNPANITVTYLWSGPSIGTTDAGGYCTLSNLSGNPQNVTFLHNTVISDSKSVLSSNNQQGGVGPNYAANAAIQNNIFVVGVGGVTEGWDSNAGEGTPTETFNYDTTSLTADHNVFPGRNGSLYTAYGNNPSYPQASPVMYFPATSYCTGATSTSSCLGMVGAMSATSMPLALADYHGYALRSDSSFYAGAPDDASDGTSMGAVIPNLDSAQTQTQYVCAVTCVCPGPYPD